MSQGFFSGIDIDFSQASPYSDASAALIKLNLEKQFKITITMNSRAVIAVVLVPGVLITVLLVLAISYIRMRHEQNNVVDLLTLERGDGKNTELSSSGGSELKDLKQDTQARPTVASQHQSDETLFERHLIKEPPPTPSKTTRKTSTEVRLSQGKDQRTPSGGVSHININGHDIKTECSDTYEPGQTTPTPQSRRDRRMKQAAETMAMLSNSASPAIKVEDAAASKALHTLPDAAINNKRGQDWVAQSLKNLVDASDSHAEEDTITAVPGLTDDEKRAKFWRKHYKSKGNLVAESLKSESEAGRESVNESPEKQTKKPRSRISFLNYIKKSVETREMAFSKVRGWVGNGEVEEGGKLREAASIQHE